MQQEETNLDDLLEDVLKDFNVLPSDASSQQPPQQLSGSQAEPFEAQPAAATQSHDSCRKAAAVSRTAGPSGLGSSLPSRPGPSRPASVTSQANEFAAAPAPAALAFDPLRKAAGAARPAPRQQQQQQQPALPPDRPLPPDVQRLADDLLRLVNESNIGSAAGSAGQQACASSSSSSSGGGGGGVGAASSTIQGLMEHTRRTVAAQSKFSRGERGPESSSGQAGARTQPPLRGAAGGLLSALGGDLGGLGGLLGAAGGGGAEDEGGLGSGMVEMIMRQLLSKDVLYTPLKEIRDKYPPWLESTSLPAEEVQRYRDQYEAIQAVVHQYDEDPNDFAKLTDLIQEMQKYGDPPAAIVEEVGGSVNQSGLFPGNDSGDQGEGGGDGLDPDDLSNFELPPDLLKDLPQEFLRELPPDMQKDCCIM